MSGSRQTHTQSLLTRAVHAGERPSRPDFTPVATPIYPSVGYLYDNLDDLDAIFATTRDGYVYPRYGSPTVTAFENAMAELEGGGAQEGSAFAFASGMAAVHAALLAAGAKSGQTIVAAFDLYGATYTLIQRLFRELGAHASLVDASDLGAVEAALQAHHPVALMVETISNPLIKVADLPALAELAHRHRAQFLVDNTFATPCLINPLMSGADYVIHSATKYIGGHGDVMAGVVVTSAENRKKLYEINKLVGGVLGPFEAWLALRGLKTLPLRARQQFASAGRVAAWLENHPQIQRTFYPGLASHPQHSLAKRLFGDRGFGGMISFEIEGAGKEKIFRFMESLQLCLPATTLGDIYSLVLYPATTSHRSLLPEERERVGIRENLVRLSVGIEDVEDILGDLGQALEKM